MEPDRCNSGTYWWGVIGYRFNSMGFKETHKFPGTTSINPTYQKQGWKFLKKY